MNTVTPPSAIPFNKYIEVCAPEQVITDPAAYKKSKWTATNVNLDDEGIVSVDVELKK